MAVGSRPLNCRSAQKNVSHSAPDPRHISAVRICSADGTMDKPVCSDKKPERRRRDLIGHRWRFHRQSAIESTLVSFNSNLGSRPCLSLIASNKPSISESGYMRRPTIGATPAEVVSGRGLLFSSLLWTLVTRFSFCSKLDFQVQPCRLGDHSWKVTFVAFGY